MTTLSTQAHRDEFWEKAVLSHQNSPRSYKYKASAVFVHNLNVLCRLMAKKLMPDIFPLRKVFNNTAPKAYHKNNLQIVRSDYTDTFSMDVLLFANGSNWFSRKGTKRREETLKALYSPNLAMSKFLIPFGVSLPSNFFFTLCHLHCLR